MKSQKFELIQQAMFDEIIGANHFGFVTQGDTNFAALVAQLAAFASEAKKSLSSNKPLVIYPNNLDGTLKLDANGLPLGRLTNAAQRLLVSMQCLPSLEHYGSSLQAYELHPSAALLSKLRETICFQAINVMTVNQPFNPREYLGQVLNNEINALRKKSRYQRHIKAVQEWEGSTQRNYRDLLHYLHSLFERHPVMNVAKLDIGYVPHFPGSASPSKLMADVESYLNTIAFDDQYAQLFGYAFRLNYTHHRGFYVHIVFMFEPTLPGSVTSRVDELGHIWFNVVKDNAGQYWHCPLDSLKGRGAGGFEIGRIPMIKDQFVSDTALYLAHMDDFIRIKRMNDAKMERWIGRGTLAKR